MKHLFIVLGFLWSFELFAFEVPGKVFYTMPDGNLVKRVVTIDVPARGMGEVVLRGENFEWRSSNFSQAQNNGRQSFTVVFPTEWQGQTADIKLMGTYIRSKNKVIYYGDMYKQKADQPLNFIGGFMFKFDR